MRRILVSRSSLENPNPLLKFVRTTSPSSTSTLPPRAFNIGTSCSVIVDFPAPERPVNQMVQPREKLVIIEVPMFSVLCPVISHYHCAVLLSKSPQLPAG